MKNNRRYILVFLAAVALALSLISCARVEIPRAFPSIDDDTATISIVVATLVPGDYLPQFATCQEPNAVCMDPAPFWFRAHVRYTVYGKPAPRMVVAATTHHFGIDGFRLHGDQPQLVLLKTDGRSFLMPRYARVKLVANDAGELFVMVWDAAPVHWLPSSIMDLRQEIDPADFPKDLEIPIDDLAADLRENPAYLNITKAGARPRYGIAVSRLQSYLNATKPTLLGVH